MADHAQTPRPCRDRHRNVRVWLSAVIAMTLAMITVPGAQAATPDRWWRQYPGAPIDLGATTVDTSAAYDINDVGQVIGDLDGDFYIWEVATGEARKLTDAEQGRLIHWAWSMNNVGQVAVNTVNGAGLWDPVDGKIVDLGTLGGTQSRDASTRIHWGRLDPSAASRAPGRKHPRAPGPPRQRSHSESEFA